MKMYKLSSVIIIFSTSISLSAQQDSSKLKDGEFEIITISDEPSVLLQDDNEVTYIYVKKMPEFPGGTKALQMYIARNMIYPISARKKRIEGTVFLKFQVKNDGSIGTIEIQKGVHTTLDNEAIRVVKSLPSFIPGEQNGKKVNVWYSIPATFKLN